MRFDRFIENRFDDEIFAPVVRQIARVIQFASATLATGDAAPQNRRAAAATGHQGIGAAGRAVAVARAAFGETALQLIRVKRMSGFGMEVNEPTTDQAAFYHICR